MQDKTISKLFLLFNIVLICFIFIMPVKGLNYTDVYPVAYSKNYVNTTSDYGVNYEGFLATDISKNLLGTWTATTWLSTTTTNQKFIIDIGTAKIIRRIYYSNGHHLGGYTDRGVKNFTVYGSNSTSTIINASYTNDVGLSQILTYNLSFEQHVSSDVADIDALLLNNSIAYRYYIFKFSNNYGAADVQALRRIVLQTQDGYLPPLSLANCSLGTIAIDQNYIIWDTTNPTREASYITSAYLNSVEIENIDGYADNIISTDLQCNTFYNLKVYTNEETCELMKQTNSCNIPLSNVNQELFYGFINQYILIIATLFVYGIALYTERLIGFIGIIISYVGILTTVNYSFLFGSVFVILIIAGLFISLSGED